MYNLDWLEYFRLVCKWFIDSQNVLKCNVSLRYKEQYSKLFMKTFLNSKKELIIIYLFQIYYLHLFVQNLKYLLLKVEEFIRNIEYKVWFYITYMSLYKSTVMWKESEYFIYNIIGNIFQL